MTPTSSHECTDDQCIPSECIPASQLTPGMALISHPGNGYAPWIGPMICKVVAGDGFVTIATVNGGARALVATDMVHVVAV